MIDFTSLLPANATALERRLEQVLARIEQIDVPVRDLWNPAACPAALLPWLAWALSVDTWRSDWPETTKRAVIAAAPQVHRLKGTLGAVRRAVAAVADGKPNRVVTWFDPDGSGLPYTAFVEVDFTTVDTLLARSTAEDLISAVAGAKSARDRVAVRLKAGMATGVKLGAVLGRPLSVGRIVGQAIVMPRLERGLKAAAVMARPMSVFTLRGDGVVLPVFRPALRAAAVLRRPVGSAVLSGAVA